MKKIIVNGGRTLKGEVSVSGSKNAALPVIFACILTNGVSQIENLPDIGDVHVALSLLSSFGAKIWKCEGITFIDTTGLSYSVPPSFLVEKIRASTYLIGGCLSRFGRCHIMRFGGCNFSLRPIDMHIDAALAFGAELDNDIIRVRQLTPCEIVFSQASVGATVNALLLASSTPGNSIIRGCAIEPHIDLLVDFLNSCGAVITRCGRDFFVKGNELHGGRVRIIGDMIEAGSYLALGLMCDGDIRVSNVPTEDMASIFSHFTMLGASIDFLSNNTLRLCMKTPSYLSLTTSPYPGFPTDLQPIFAPLMAAFCGGDITDNVWQGRFGYLNSLSDFGISSRVSGNYANVFVSGLHSGNSIAPDLRGGMAGLLCALCSMGKSEITSAETILRGYENITEKLCNIGAEIKITDI